MKKSCKGKKVSIHAHVNPLSDTAQEVPLSPEHVDWEQLLKVPDEQETAFKKELLDCCETRIRPAFADVGCGFGGLLMDLGRAFPSKIGVGLEIRTKAVEIVKQRIKEGRKNGDKSNTCVVLCNAMKHLSNYLERGSLEFLVFAFADPHFKRTNHRRRIISAHLLDVYAYLLRERGLICCITDVIDLHEWTEQCLRDHPLFVALSPEELESPLIVQLTQLISNTDEGKKVDREGGNKYPCFFRKVSPSQTQVSKGICR